MPIELAGWDDMVSGAEEIVGDDYMAIGEDDVVLGADDDLKDLLAVSGARFRPRKLSAIARKHAVAVQQRAATHARRFPLGFVSGTISTLAEVDVMQAPQIPFRAERLIVPSDIATFFVIIDVKIGNRSQLVSAGEIPAVAFSEVGFGANLRLDTAQVSQAIVIRVKNVSGSSQIFRAALLGTAVY